MSADKDRRIARLSLLITHRDENDWCVWISLPDHDPLDDAFGFVIGSGETRDQAVGDAVMVLEAAVEQLQGPRGGIEERKVFI